MLSAGYLVVNLGFRLVSQAPQNQASVIPRLHSRMLPMKNLPAMPLKTGIQGMFLDSGQKHAGMTVLCSLVPKLQLGNQRKAILWR